MCSARFSWRSPPRLSRCRLIGPLEASTGLVPASAAKEASERIRPWLPLETNSCAAQIGPTPHSASNGEACSASRCSSSRSVCRSSCASASARLPKLVVERAMSAELSDHLGYELGDEPPEGEPNRRNGSTSKTLITDHGLVPVEVPRDREGSFEPLIVPKHQRRFAGFDDKIISM